MDDMSDEEKSFHEWIERNIQYINQNKSSIHVMKDLYISGFAAGWLHRDKYNAMEQLQK
jgi:hypothetical protein